MDIQKISNAMLSWAEAAQQEYVATQEAIAQTLSANVEEGGFSIFDPTSWNENNAQSEKSRFEANIDRAWIVQKVSGIVTRFQQATNIDEQRAAINKFYDFIKSLTDSAPQSILAWKNIESQQLGDDLDSLGTTEKPKLSRKELMIRVSAATVGLGLAYTLQPSQRRQNPFIFGIPAAIAALGWLKGGAIVIGTGLALGAGVAGVISLADGVQTETQFNLLSGKIKSLKEKVEDGQRYQAIESKTAFYTAIAFPNAMRTCAINASIAQEQTEYILYASAYATGNKSYADLAEDLKGGFFSSSKFKDFNAAEVEMKKVSQLLNQDSSPLVRMLAQDFAMLTTATCMNASVKDVELQKVGGGDACPDEDAFETIIKTLEGLFMFGEKPCRFTDKQWRRVRMAVYIPMGVISLPYILPVLKPLTQIATKKLEKIADEE